MLTLSIYHKSNVILVPKLCKNPLETIFHRSKKFYLKTLKSISENYFVLFIIFQQIFLLPRSWMMPNPTGLVLLIYQKIFDAIKKYLRLTWCRWWGWNCCLWPCAGFLADSFLNNLILSLGFFLLPGGTRPQSGHFSTGTNVKYYSAAPNIIFKIPV